MNSYTTNMLSKFKNGLNSWIALWQFLIHLENLDFYEGLDELNKREIQRTREAYQGSDLCAALVAFVVGGGRAAKMRLAVREPQVITLATALGNGIRHEGRFCLTTASRGTQYKAPRPSS